MEELNEEVKKAYELWQSLNENEEERDAAERRYLDLASLEYAKKYEYNLGKEEGKEEGKVENQKEIALAMLKEKFPIDLIEKITKLSKEEIEKIKN